MRNSFVILAIVWYLVGYAQFPPQAGLPGSTAIPADSKLIKFWANFAVVKRGYLNIADTNFTIDGSNRASYGSVENVFGPADGTMGVLSLGDGGEIIVSFPVMIRDGEGWDFVVFENGFQSLEDPNFAFLELAYVEVSSDGKHFYRFPNVSLTQDSIQIGTFGFLDARKIHNLAGKYIAGFGTPFDLSDLKPIADQYLNLDSIKFVKIIDVVGCISDSCANLDSYGHKINDPFPTPFASGGFDLDAVGVINYSYPNFEVDVFPNPTTSVVNFTSTETILNIKIYNSEGKLLISQKVNRNFVRLNLSFLPQGLYFCIIFSEQNKASKIIIKL